MKRLSDAINEINNALFGERQRGMPEGRVLLDKRSLLAFYHDWSDQDANLRNLYQQKQSLLIDNQKLESDRDALAAQVEAMTAHGSTLATAASMATGAMAVGSPVTKLCVEAVKRFNAVKASAPQQCLRDVKAEAGRAGFFAAINLVRMQPERANHAVFVCQKADEYAAKVRKGGE